MFLLIITILQLFIISAKLEETTKSLLLNEFLFFKILGIKSSAEDEKLRDQDGYLAIKAIHGVLDNDQSGSIERYESADVT